MRTWFAICLVLGSAACSHGATVRVTAATAELRTSPGEDGVLVSKCERGEFLQTLSRREGWVQIVPPGSVSVWIHGEMISDSRVRAVSAPVRAGPGLDYGVVASLTKGTRVRVLGALGEWQRIRIPDGSVLWVSAKSVSSIVQDQQASVPPAKARPVPSAPPKVETVPVDTARKPDVITEVIVTPVTRPTEAAVETEDGGVPSWEREKMPPPPLVPTREVKYEGTVRPAPYVWRRPSLFRLLQTDDRGRTVFECYLQGSEGRLKSLVGSEVVVRGREYSVQGVRNSVVWIDDISEKSGR